MPADAGGEVGRTNAVARFAREELFDDPILERVKGDDRDPASGAEDAHRAFERHREVRELVIHRDAERLEDPRGRIDAPRTAGLHARDEAAELVSGPEGRLGAATDDRPGDPCGFGLFAVFGEDAAKVVPGPAVHDVGCSEAKVRVGTHIQRASRAKAEAPLFVGKLERAEPEIQEDAVDRCEVVRAGHVVKTREVGPDEYGAIAEASELLRRGGKRLGIAVDPEELSARPASLEDGRGVASGADRPVEITARFMGIKLGEYFGEKNRLMCESGGSALRPPNNRIPTRSRGP